MRSFVLAAIILACAATAATAQQSIPENARRVSWGKGWTCEAAYVERGNQCVHLSAASDAEIRQHLVNQSIAAYSGSCPCPFNTDRAGRRCGGRSAYSRPGGSSPRCYASDISDAEIQRVRERYPRRP
jgi:hypothetical protein